MKKLFVTICVLALLVAACSSSDSTETTVAIETTTSSATGGSSSGATTTTAAADTTTTAGADTTTTTVAASSGSIAECVVGAWELDTDGFFELLAAEMENEEGIEEFEHVDGAYRLVVDADGTFESRRDDWTFAVVSDFGVLEMTMNASETGTWTVDGNVLSTTITGGEAAEIQMTVDGVPFNLPGGGSPIEPPSASFEGATVTCDGDTMSATGTGEDFGSVWRRVG